MAYLTARTRLCPCGALVLQGMAARAPHGEVADAAAVADTIDRRLTALQQLAEDTQVTFDLSGERFKSGLDGYLTVLDAQREYYNAQQQLILARLDNNLNSIALYKALGTWTED